MSHKKQLPKQSSIAPTSEVASSVCFTAQLLYHPLTFLHRDQSEVDTHKRGPGHESLFSTAIYRSLEKCCPWALSAAEKNRALCSGMVLNGGPEQFPREETERLIDSLSFLLEDRAVHWGHNLHLAYQMWQNLMMRWLSLVHAFVQALNKTGVFLFLRQNAIRCA
ncbi:Uncharacterized protein DAT39_010177 [Clarias magur]|uniref:Uncharacterized protein n=1 Tax=Clarias magur TaxID=1594786 RepID=A0A8J4X3G7_CLAMG|nr:Uncharacterized protein DAT39_010177 [Clarias magur]